MGLVEAEHVLAGDAFGGGQVSLDTQPVVRMPGRKHAAVESAAGECLRIVLLFLDHRKASGFQLLKLVGRERRVPQHVREQLQE